MRAAQILERKPACACGAAFALAFVLAVALGLLPGFAAQAHAELRAQGGELQTQASSEPYEVSLSVDGAQTITSYNTKDILNLGKTVTATAKDSAGATIDASELTWSWYAGDGYYSSYASEENRIEGATSATFTPTDEALIGKYLFAQASDGSKTVTSHASGKLVSAHAVELYGVTVEGGLGGSVGVGDTLSAVATKVKYISGTSSTTYVNVDPDDDVTYQWQYATSASTSDSAFTDIEGATSSTYTITYDMAGKYLRVKATSIATVVSTQKKQYGATTSVSPVGPVQEVAGSMQLSSVSLSASPGNSMWVGSTVTPSANYIPSGSYIEQAVPNGAAVTYTWKVAESQSGPYVEFDPAAYSQSSLTATNQLLIGEDLLGKWVRIEANAHMNTVMSLNWRVLPQGVYDLLRITFQTSGALFTGQRLNTNLQAKDLDYANEASYGIQVPYQNPYIVYEWFYGPEADGSEWTAIPDSDVPDLLSIPDEAAGNYIKVVAKSSSDDAYATTVERVSNYKVLSGEELASAPTKLSEIMYKPVPRWKTATNLNEMVSDKLDSLGFHDVTVKTTSFSQTNVHPDIRVGVSTANDDTNGDVTFFSYEGSMDDKPASLSIYHQAAVEFELSRGGEEPVSYSATINIPWDLDAAQNIFDDQVKGLAIKYAEGDDAASVTQNLTLPCKAGILWVEWSSSNEDALRIYRDESSASALWDPYTGIVARTSDDVVVTLTAHVDSSLIDSTDESLDALDAPFEFPVTVKGDPEMVAREIAAIAEKVDANFVAENLKASDTGATVYPGAVDADIQLLNSRTLLSGLNTGKYRIAYSVDNPDAITINAYRANVFRPLPGADATEVGLTVTVTHREIPDAAYSKTIPLTIKPLTTDELEEDLACMEQVKNNVFKGLSEGKQEARGVTSDLHVFQRAYFTDEGVLAWQYDRNDTSGDKYAIGFSPQTVAENPSSDTSYSNFVSSSPYVASSSLKVVQRPRNDTGVGVTCCLSSDRFGDYYDHYKDDASCSSELKDTFKALNRQRVTVYFTLLGTVVNAAASEALSSAISDAEAALDKVVASANGSDVPENAQWASEEARKALADAIATAKAVESKSGVTSVEVVDAAEALQKALEAFNQASKPGLAPAKSGDGKDDGSGDGASSASEAPTFVVAPAKAQKFEVGKLKYSVVKTATSSAGTARVVGFAKGAKKSGALSIPKTVKYGDATYKVIGIGAKAFAGSGITKAVIGANVAKVGAQAFAKCKKLKAVTMGKNVKTIGAKAFFNDKKLKNVTIKGKKLKTIGKAAFKGTSKRMAVKAPKAKKKAYKKLLVKAGASKKLKMK